MDVLFFAGQDVPIKRYTSYFPMLNLISSDKWEQKENIVILCHSIGILHALIWCEEKNIIPRIIVSMDGVSLLTKDIHREVYVKFIAAKIDYTKYNIHLYRQKSKQSIDDVQYNKIDYYDGDHYPFTQKKIRDSIVRSLLV